MFAIRDRRHVLLTAAVTLTAMGCHRSPYEGFKEIEPGLYYRLHALGDDTGPPGDEDSVLLRLRAALHDHPPGSLFSTERWYGLQHTDPLRRKIIARMHEGDSVSVIAGYGAIPWSWLAGGAGPAVSGDTVMVDLELRIMDVMTPAEATAAAERRRLADPVGHENRALAPFMDSTWNNWDDVMYYRILDKGDASLPVRSSDLVTIHYQGSFTDGTVFDDTRRAGQPMTFRLGDPDQVIKGIETALHLLNKGGRGTFAMRSSLAFGEKGVAGGRVPPYTPVVYTVEVLEVVEPAAP